MQVKTITEHITRPQLTPAREANFVCMQTTVKSYTYQEKIVDWIEFKG